MSRKTRREGAQRAERALAEIEAHHNRGSVVAWVAGADGLAHHQVAGALRASCGVPWLAARWAWPEVRRCAECQLAGGRLPVGGAEPGGPA